MPPPSEWSIHKITGRPDRFLVNNDFLFECWYQYFFNLARSGRLIDDIGIQKHNMFIRFFMNIFTNACVGGILSLNILEFQVIF